MHDKIEKFSLTGEISDKNIVEERERLIHWVENSMRDHQAVPALDMEPQFTLDYIPATETYNFELTVYGIQVDKELVCTTAGMMGGKMITKYTTKPKLKQS